MKNGALNIFGLIKKKKKKKKSELFFVPAAVFGLAFGWSELWYMMCLHLKRS